MSGGRQVNSHHVSIAGRLPRRRAAPSPRCPLRSKYKPIGEPSSRRYMVLWAGIRGMGVDYTHTCTVIGYLGAYFASAPLRLLSSRGERIHFSGPLSVVSRLCRGPSSSYGVRSRLGRSVDSGMPMAPFPWISGHGFPPWCFSNTAHEQCVSLFTSTSGQSRCMLAGGYIFPTPPANSGM